MKLTNEQFEKLSTFDSSQEAAEYLESEGVELSPEDLEGIAGGNGWGTCPTCPKCGASKGIFDAFCNNCGWKVRCPGCGEYLSQITGCFKCDWKAPIFGG